MPKNVRPQTVHKGTVLLCSAPCVFSLSLHPFVLNYFYSPFGEIWQGEVSCDTNPFRYAGEYLDKETGNIYLRARYFSPTIGRFITVDPIKDGTNWYVYCGNNPVAFVDPSGLAEQYFKNPPQGSGTPENDSAILNDKGLLYVNRLTSIYKLPEVQNNTLVADAIHYQINKIRTDTNYHKPNIENNSYADGFWDPYVYSNYQRMFIDVKIEIYEYNTLSANWENGNILNFISDGFSSMPECGDIPFGPYTIPLGSIVEWGDFIANGINEFIFKPVGVDSDDSKITIHTSGLPSQKTTFYFYDDEIQWFKASNVKALENN